MLPLRESVRHSMVVLLAAVIGAATTASAEPARHEKTYWQAIVRAGYAVPADKTPFELARELSELLGSPDPELRDGIAYSILSAWISDETKFSDKELLELLTAWQASLAVGNDRPGSDAVLRRSFSALALALLAERDLTKPFLGSQRYQALLDSSIAYLTAERDLRGFDAARGWVHATAHTADLLAALSRSAHLTAPGQKQVLGAIATRLTTAPEVFTQGEQDRLAQAVTMIVRRPDFDRAAFDAWLTGIRETRRQAARTRPMTPTTLAPYQNKTYFLQALYVRLSLETLEGAAAGGGAAVLDVLRPR
jgi:hypothetical protein